MNSSGTDTGMGTGEPEPGGQDSRRSDPVLLTGSALVVGVVALVCEVILFAGLAQLAHHLAGGGTVGIVVAVLALALGAVGWGVFMAPTARRRLPSRARALVCLVAGVALGAGLVASGWTIWGVVVAVAGVLCAATNLRATGGDAR